VNKISLKSQHVYSVTCNRSVCVCVRVRACKLQISHNRLRDLAETKKLDAEHGY